MNKSSLEFLTKTRFKIGLECPTKLYYLSKEYPSSKDKNEFLQVHADGGHQVGEYAKYVIRAKYPNHRFVDLSDDLECVDRTTELLFEENVIIAESAHLSYDTYFIRIDLLVKTGRNIELIEVKSKSIQSDDSFFKVKNGITEVKREWTPYIADIAFQYEVLTDSLDPIFRKEYNIPDNIMYFRDTDKDWYNISAYMMILDKNKTCNIDKLNQYFLLEKDKNNRVDVTLTDKQFLSKFNAELQDSIMTIRDVTDVVHLINNPERGPSGHNRMSKKIKFPFTNIQDPTPLKGFFQVADYLAWLYQNKRKDSREAYGDMLKERNMFGTSSGLEAKLFLEKYPQINRVGSYCKDCEYNVKDNSKNGFNECWKEQFPDFDPKKDHIFELWNYSKSDVFIKKGFHSLKHMLENNYPTINTDSKSFKRQKTQIEKSISKNSNDDIEWTSKELKGEIESWTYPLHFIDFETCQVALPFHKNQFPFTLIASQYSCHSLYEDGSIKHHEWIAKQSDNDPSFEFADKLMNILNKDQGRIFMYSNYENYVLKEVKKRMVSFDNQRYKECIDFIDSITFDNKENYHPDREMIDLRKIVVDHYYHVGMKGSNSLKAVLPAIMETSKVLKKKYSTPLDFGTNLNDITFFQKQDNKVQDPYKILPKIKPTIQSSNTLFNSELLADGAAAMEAFKIIQFSTIISDEEKNNLIKALLNYCELDTLAMVMLFEHLKYST